MGQVFGQDGVEGKGCLVSKGVQTGDDGVNGVQLWHQVVVLDGHCEHFFPVVDH